MRRALLVSSLGFLAAAGCGSGHAGVAPWVDRPLPLYRAPGPKLIRYPTTAPPCRGGELRVSQGRGGAAAGNDSEPLLFTNTGSRTCLLRGYPAVTAETSAGSRVTLHPRHGTFFGPSVAADIAPRRHVFLVFGTSGGCQGGAKPVVRYRDLRFTLPQGGTVAGGQSTLSRQCGLDMSGFGLPARYAPLRPRPGSVGTLRAAIQIPSHLRAGAKELDFTVTLRNPTGETVRLAPCPGYTMGFYAPNMSVHRSFGLDCDSVHAIPAHGRADFAMRLALPRPLPRDPAVKVGWSIDTPNGPFAGRGLVVGK